jgi:transposase InsO family protein
MASVTQDLMFKQSVCKYSQKHGVTAAARFYKKTRQWIYYWLRRYDGTPQSLREKSRRPKSHPNQHTPIELKLIVDIRRRMPDEGLVDFWVRLKRKGYARSIPALFRVMRRLGYFKSKKKKPKYVPKPYEKMSYPGQRVQIDVKFVPKKCCEGMPNQQKLYQFTAIDEYSRARYLEGFDDNSSYSAAIFIRNAAKAFGFKIECVQSDNGLEFVKWGEARSKPSLFQKQLAAMGIRHKLIRPFTPRHNGKVERSHRKDNERFYSRHSFYSLNDFNAQLKRYNREYNNFPMRPLNWLSPNQILHNFFALGVILV